MSMYVEKEYKTNVFHTFLSTKKNVNGTVMSIMQKQRNRRRWTEQQREQSRKFWERKKSKENAKRLFIDEYIKSFPSLQQPTSEQAIFYMQNRIPRRDFDIFLKQITHEDIILLLNHGFNTFALKNIGIIWTKQSLIDWKSGAAPEDLINSILVYKGINPWVENNKEEKDALSKGLELINDYPCEISKQFKIDTSANAKVFCLNKSKYLSAVLHETIRQALIKPSFLTEDIFELIEQRIALLESEHAIQSSDCIYLLEDNIDKSTIVHELIHFYGKQDRFINEFCFGVATKINEGFTEYFARKVFKPNKNRKRTIYPQWINVVDYLVKMLGEDILRNAYFNGATHILKLRFKRVMGVDWSKNEEAKLYRNNEVLSTTKKYSDLK